MKVTCIHDAMSQRLIFLPETDLEKMQLGQMANQSEKGVKTTLTHGKDEPTEFHLEVS